MDFSTCYLELVDRLMKELGAVSRAETTRRSLDLLNLASQVNRSGGKLGVMTEDGTFSPILIPGLPSVDWHKDKFEKRPR